MASQYVQDDTGAKFIPATQRPDGTWRKARRVKDGYVPQEEMPLYESKGKQWAKNKPTLPPGLHPEDVAKVESMQNQNHLQPPLPVSSHGSPSVAGMGNTSAPQSNPLQGLSKSAKKNAKRKEKKKEKQSLLLSQDQNTVAESMKELTLSNNNEKNINIQPHSTCSVHSTETEKRLKHLRKKLREIEILKEKMVTGWLPNPDKDQLEKINREIDIQKEIEELESLTRT